MNRWIKTIIGAALIAAALAAMYYWNMQGRLKIKEAEEAEALAQEAEIKVDPKAEMLNSGKSYFPVPTEWIATKSVKIVPGDFVGIYYKSMVKSETDTEADNQNTKTEINVKNKDVFNSLYPSTEEYKEYKTSKFGKFEVAYVDDTSVEIICNLDEYVKLENMLAGESEKIMMIMEAKDE